jgi:hypothetical protein
VVARRLVLSRLRRLGAIEDSIGEQLHAVVQEEPRQGESVVIPNVLPLKSAKGLEGASA